MANEGSANINLNVRATVSGNASQSFDAMASSSKRVQDGLNSAGSAAQQFGDKFSGIGGKINSEFFELNNRKVRQFTDMFLGGGAFGLAMSAANFAVSALAKVVKDEFANAVETSEDRVASLLKQIEKARGAFASSALGERDRIAQQLADLETLQTKRTQELVALEDYGKSVAGNYFQTDEAIRKTKKAREDLATTNAMLAASEIEFAKAQDSYVSGLKGVAAQEARWDKDKIKEKKAAVDEYNYARIQGEKEFRDTLLDTTALDKLMGKESPEAIEKRNKELLAENRRRLMAEVEIQQEAHKKSQELAAQHQNAMNDIMNTGTQGTLNAFIGAWGSAFEQIGRTGKMSMKDLASGFLASLGQVAMQMGQMLILAGTGWSLIPGFQASIGSIAAGVGLVALGGVMKGMAGRSGGEPSSALGGYGRSSSAYGGVPNTGGSSGGYGGNTTNNSTYTVNLNGTFMGDQNQMAQMMDQAFSRARRNGYV